MKRIIVGICLIGMCAFGQYGAGGFSSGIGISGPLTTGQVVVATGSSSIGTSLPAYDLEVMNKILLGDQSGEYVRLETQPEFDLTYIKPTGPATIDFRAIPSDGSSGANFRFGLSSGSTGANLIRLYSPNSSTIDHQIGSGNWTYFCADEGNGQNAVIIGDTSRYTSASDVIFEIDYLHPNNDSEGITNSVIPTTGNIYLLLTDWTFWEAIGTSGTAQALTNTTYWSQITSSSEVDPKAMMLPRMGTTARNALDKEPGMIVYDVEVGAVFVTDGTTWTQL